MYLGCRVDLCTHEVGCFADNNSCWLCQCYSNFNSEEPLCLSRD
ncbi:unnamed protein product [Moneuplotes crassus]|uniref:Uncharacterized protein n=1 Tax=Euplotes crassus TaxID=5936 RepID=A0AAD1Y4J5_EUPCR|nr:unnamed protein product [Moneuplotes crassus]